ncbi:hypothetical protein LCGC14_1191130 [marine sediment metagenome]|uniref:Uncharacterized protein n=1 Tax=marine sediment metagenome TaxID=412755 RepID=A0A0F9LJC1_9ZZZZ
MKDKKKNKIKATKRTCGCGKRVFFHHIYCQRCWKINKYLKNNKLKYSWN